MDHRIAGHILGSRTVEELRDLSGLGIKEGTGASKADVAEHARALADDLAQAQRALGVKVADAEGLRLAKDRLLTAMEQSADLVSLGREGSILRGGDFNGAAGEGVLTAEAAREIVNPDRPNPEGARWVLATGSGGALAAKGAKSAVSPEGLVAVDAKRVGAKLASRLEAALGGFEGVWEAVGECADNQRRLGSLGGADCWDPAEVRARLEESFSTRLAPLAPGAPGFPPAIEASDVGGKLLARRQGAQAAPKAPSSAY